MSKFFIFFFKNYPQGHDVSELSESESEESDAEEDNFEDDIIFLRSLDPKLILRLKFYVLEDFLGLMHHLG